MSWIQRIFRSNSRTIRPSTELEIFVANLSKDAVSQLSTSTSEELRAPTALALLALRAANGYAKFLEEALRGMRKSFKSDVTDFDYNAVMVEAVAFAVFCCMLGFVSVSDRLLYDDDPEEEGGQFDEDDREVEDVHFDDGYFKSLKWAGGIVAGILERHGALKDTKSFTNLLGGYSATRGRNDDVVGLFLRRVVAAINAGEPFAPVAIQTATVGWDWAQFKDDMRVFYEAFVSASCPNVPKHG